MQRNLQQNKSIDFTDVFGQHMWNIESLEIVKGEKK